MSAFLNNQLLTLCAEETLPLVASGKDKCETTETTANHDVNSVFECSPDTQEEDCGENEECTFVMADERVKYGCECVTGFVMDPITLVCHESKCARCFQF